MGVVGRVDLQAFLGLDGVEAVPWISSLVMASSGSDSMVVWRVVIVGRWCSV